MTSPSERQDHAEPLPPQFAGLGFNNRYARLPKEFFARVNPTPVRAPQLVKVNHELAEELGLDAKALESTEGVAMLAGNLLPPGAEPLAQAYSGHQFGYFNPQLGDGRAILLGEIIDRHGKYRDIQLKGSGPTPFSRRGDGRAALGPVIREYILSEAMHALGVKTTRSLAAVATGEQVYREAVLPGAVLTRVASSHVRIGTFEFLKERDHTSLIKQLADFVIERHYPQVAEAHNPYLALLDAVIDAQASLIASWMHIGFIHGVMNTDNMSVSGETIDYGPCAFMDRYDPAAVFSSIDRGGRYAFGNQPNIAVWNLSRFAECLLHLFDDNQDKAIALAEERLKRFDGIFGDCWMAGLRRKLGLNQEREGDNATVEAFLTLMQLNQADFTKSFRYLSDFLVRDQEIAARDDKLFGLFQTRPEALQEWLQHWQQRLASEPEPVSQVAAAMRRVNPVYIPRNHRVEAVIQAALKGEFQPLHEMVAVLSRPFEEQPGMERYDELPAPGQEVTQTFCGT